ncbi:barttin [Hypanus sabinus]|uniref:barttin n=1 Tax=Hypanus sabinus TaxID=79690 RepID=UPI0028C44189|nr:barttin [Hypanus sabinus]
MAEDKTFSYSLIVLGFFLIMVGMFIMNVDKPGVYGTFCSIGIVMITGGIIWAICLCYPQIQFAPAVSPETKLLFPKHQLPASVLESEVPLKTSSCEQATQYEQTLHNYEKDHLTVSSELPDVHAPLTSLQPEQLDGEGHSSLKAEVLVHKDSGNEGETCSSWNDITVFDGKKAGGYIIAPLATFQEDSGMVSSSPSNNLSLLGYKSSCSRSEGQSHPIQSESATSDSWSLRTQPAASVSGSNQRDVTSTERSTSDESQKRGGHMEDEMFYGICDERNHIFEESEQEVYYTEIPM